MTPYLDVQDIFRKARRARRIEALCDYSGVQLIALLALWTLLIQAGGTVPMHALVAIPTWMAALTYFSNLWKEW
jgi:hypothetical protein